MVRLSHETDSPLLAINRLVKLRNTFAHGTSPSEEAASALLPDLKDSLLTAVSKLGDLTRFRAIAYEDVFRQPLQTGFRATVRFCDGCGPTRSRSASAGVRVIRGGSWTSEERNLRPADRRGQNERDAVRSCGFRLVVRGAPERYLFIDDLDPSDVQDSNQPRPTGQ